MAFPQVRSAVTESASATAATTLTVNFHASAAKGDLVVAFIALNDTAQTITTTESFTDWTNASATFHIIRKVLDGTEGTSTTVTVGTATRFAAIAYTIQGGTHAESIAPAISTVATGTSTGPDATSCAPTGSAKDYLWISAFRQNGEEADDDTWCNNGPTNFTGLVQKTSGTTGLPATNGSVAAAQYNLNATSLDAGAFNTDQSLAWRAYTIAVYPEVDGSFTANAYIVATVSGSTTANAIIKKTIQWPFTLDAKITPVPVTYPGSFTANAWFKKTLSGSFSANAILKKTMVPAGGGGDTTLFEDTFTRTETDTWGTSSSGHAWTYISSAASNFDVNGSEGTITHSGYSRQRQQALDNVTANPVEMYGEYLYVSQPPSLSLLEMYLQLRYENSGTETGYVLRMQHYSGGGTINHLLMHEGTGGYNQMADANSALTSEIGIWWACRFRITTLENGNVRLQTKVWKKASGEPASWEIDHEDSTYKDTSGDATVETYPGFNFDGTRTYKWDNVKIIAVGAGGGGAQPTADALLKKVQSGTFGANAIILATQTPAIPPAPTGFYAAAWVTAGAMTVTSDFKADAVLFKAMAGAATVNAVILANSGTKTASAEAWIVRVQSGSFTTNAIIRRAQAGSFVASSVISRSQSGAFTAATVKRAAIAGALTSDAVLVRSQSGNIAANAIIKRAQAGTFGANAIVVAVRSGAIPTDATVLWTATKSFSVEAWFPASWTTISDSFSAEAYVSLVGRCTWVSPPDGTQMDVSPVLVFRMPDAASGDMHFEIEIDDDSGYGSPIVYRSTLLTGWEFWDGDSWEPIPQAGVPNTYCGNEARYTAQEPLGNATWYRRVRAGVI